MLQNFYFFHKNAYCVYSIVLQSVNIKSEFVQISPELSDIFRPSSVHKSQKILQY